MSRPGFGEDFGQKVDLTASIRNILRNYPEGTAVLKELVQNADDAGAHSVSFCLDCRSHQTSKVAGPLMGQFQGPSLVSYNDAVFTEEDFRSIQRIGDSLKKSEESKAKIGRFGIGFNAVYHWTDVPSFISSRYLVLLDPQARFLPDVNPSNPGKMVDWLSKPELLESFSDQFTPYLGHSNLSYEHEFEGTLFRLPLRTEEQARSSMLSKRHLSVGDALQLLEALHVEASAMLLFLKNIDCIEVKVWRDTESSPQMLFKCQIGNVTRDLQIQRGLGQLPTHLAVKDASSKGVGNNVVQTQKADFALQIDCESPGCSYVERWEVCNQLGGVGANRIAHDPANALLRLVPWGGLAACVGSTQDLASLPPALRSPVAGLAYCFLPLPVLTGLPVMVNGFFELSSNRRDIWQAGPDMTGDGKTRAEWNLSLLTDVIGPSYIRLLIRLRDSLGYSDVYQSMWPSSSLAAPWSLLATSTLMMSRGERLLLASSDASGPPSPSSLSGSWIQTDQAVLLPSDNRLSDSCRAELMTFLRKSRQPFVACADAFRVTLISSRTCQELATPAFVRAVLRQRVDGSKTKSYVPELDMCPFLLHYCLLDCSPDSPGAELDRLFVLPLLSRAVGSLRIYSSGQSEKIKSICDMGFTFSQATGALNAADYALEAAMELLTAEPTAVGNGKGESAVAVRSDPIYILAGEEESRVFKKASSVLLDRSRVGPAEIDFLQSPPMLRASNVRSLRAQIIPELLRHILPPAFFDGKCVASSALHSDAGDVAAFLADFWRYSAPRGDVVDAVAQGAALVPSQGLRAFLPLSRLSGLLVASRGDVNLPPAIQDIFGALGLHFVDASALPDNGSMCNSFWQYVYGPSRSALLAALDFANKQSPPRLLGRSPLMTLAPAQVDALRGHLCSCEPVAYLTDSDKETLRRLPLFRAYGGGAEYVSVDDFRNRNVCYLVDAARIPESLFPSHFLSQGSAQEASLLSSLGVRALRRSDYFRLELLPRVKNLHAALPADTTGALLTMVDDVKSLIDEDKSFLSFLKESEFLPALGEPPRMCRACDLFDPHVSSLRLILDDSFFPSPPFQQEEALVLLRSLGLQGSLDWPAVVACAKAIECAPAAPARVERAAALLRYLDRNVATLLKADRGGATGFILNLAQSIFREKDRWSTQQKKMTVDDYISELRRVRWVPVLSRALGACMPWPAAAADDLAAPCDVRPVADAWLCSATKRLLAERSVCEELSRLLLWSGDLDISTVACQLRELSRKFVLLKEGVGSLDATGSIVSEPDRLTLQGAREEITSAIPQLYQRLNAAVSGSQDKAAVCELLLGEQWIWVGDAFVSPSRVAVTSTINAAPYLYSLPQDLRVYATLLKAFDVKNAFSPRDYIEVLGAMASETAAGTRALSDDNMDLAVSLVTLLSMEGSVNHYNHAIYAPDNTNRLALSTTLVNDDVPWLSGPDYASARAGCRLVHPSISSHVAERLGVSSLRLTIVNRSLEQNIFSLPDANAASVEAFGQAESLTGRLKTILDLYPDGNPIFSELIQNADDAGASIVRIMIDMNSYGTESLLDSKMAPLQGPALLVCNDASFTEADFKSLARIGQGSKLEKLATTGRFGLGFSSTYHLTDTPTFVSGSHLVVFDPHCCFAPGATLNQPGLRIKLNDSSLKKTFPDQFAPLEFFGCDFSQPYKGTLFRFPLRTSALARRSEISKRSYTIADVEANLAQFVGSLSQNLLFLRSVRCIEIYQCGVGERAPVLLHRARSAVSDSEARGELALMAFFDRQQPTPAASSKEDFYRRLAGTPEGRLPLKSCRMSLLVESFHTELRSPEGDAAARAVGVARAVEVPAPPGEAVNCSIDASKTAALLCAREEALYLLVAGLCGGEARRVACSEDMRHLKLVPLGAIAACLARSGCAHSSTGGLFSGVPGQAYCFLPLPVLTGLPVHVNAYWELSSNRRDIWRGDDTTGEARLRSEWNTHVMRDVVAPLYKELLVRCAGMCGQQLNWAGNTLQGRTSDLLSLLPCPLPSAPWNVVSAALLPLLQNEKLLYSRLGGGMTLSLRDAVLLEGEGRDDGEGAVRTRLEALLLEEGVAVVLLPPPVHKALLSSGCAGAAVSPEYVRALLADPRQHPTLAGDASVSNATFYLHYCLRDINRSNYSAMQGIGVLPLEDGSLGKIGGPTDAPLFLATDAERRLLSRSAGRRLLAADPVLGAAAALLKDAAFAACCNVRALQPADVIALIAAVVPPEWLAAEPRPVDVRSVLGDDWLLSLWSYVLDSKVVDLFREGLPMLPVLRLPSTCGEDGALPAVRISAAVPVLHMSHRDMSAPAADALARLGLYILDPGVLGALSYSPAVMALLQEPSAAGVLAALCLLQHRFALVNTWAGAARNAMRDFVLESLLSKVDSVSTDVAAALATLPVWQCHGRTEDEYASGSAAVYTALVCPAGRLRLPPAMVDPLLLDGKYVRTRGPRDDAPYRLLGVEQHSQGDFFADYVVVKLNEGGHFTDAQTDALAVDALGSLGTLTKENPTLGESLGSCPFVRTSAGRLAAPSSLFDPSPLLQSLLPEELFPCPRLFSTPQLLLALKQLGLRTSVNCAGVILAARAVQASLDQSRSLQPECDEKSVCMKRTLARAAALLKYMEVNVEELLLEADPQVFAAVASGEGGSNNVGGSWAQELRTLMWLPVLTHPPRGSRAVDGLPWPERVHVSALAAPSQCRPLQDLWAGSSTHRICCVDVLSSPLRLLLGWNRPLAGRNVALQLLNMREAHSKDAVTREAVAVVYSREVPRIFEAMNAAFEKESPVETQVWLRVLRDKPVVWIGGDFVEASRIAVDPLPGVNCEPFLYSLAGELLSYPLLMRALGVRPRFEAADLAALTRIAWRGSGEGPLGAHLQACVGAVKILSRLVNGQGVEDVAGGEAGGGVAEEEEGEEEGEEEAVEPSPAATDPHIPLSSLGAIYLPDRNGVLALASTLVYDDAPWIYRALSHKNAAAIRFVHTAILNDEAATLGAKSLREQLFAGDSVVCPEAHALRAILGADSVHETLSDLLSLADILGARSMNVLYDEAEHLCESLMHPGLADAQGPGLLVHLDGPALSTEELAQLLTSPHLLPCLPGELAQQQWAAGVSSPAKGAPSSHTDSQAVRYPFPTSGKRLVSAFAVADCLQIVSGGEFYIFDPTGMHLLAGGDEPAVKGRADAPRARAQRCSLLGANKSSADTDVLYRFPDQFAPFLSAPFSLEAVLKGKGTFPGLLIRMPLRRSPSAVSDVVASVDDVKEALRLHRAQMQSALLFASNLAGGSVQHRLLHGAAEKDFEVWLASSQGARDKRWALLSDRGWKRSGISSIFSAPFVPPEVSNELVVRTRLYGLRLGDDDGAYGWLRWDCGSPSLQRPRAGGEPDADGALEMEDTWLLCSISGHGRLRDLAVATPYRTMKLQPLVTLAIRLLSPAEAAPGALARSPEPGQLFCGGGPVGSLGLPYAVEGPFLHDFLARTVPLLKRDGDAGGAAAKITVSVKVGKAEDGQTLARTVIETWNSAILSVALEKLLPRALQRALALSRKEHAESFYKYWPYRTRVAPGALYTLEQSRVYSLLAELPIFLIVSGFRSLKDTVIPDSYLRPEVQTFLQSILPLALTPSQVAADLASARVSTQCLSPARLRDFLRKDGSDLRVRLAGKPDLVLQLLKYALADAERALKGIEGGQGEFHMRKLFREVGGTPLLPMADGSVRSFPKSAREAAVLAPPILHALLPQLKAQFVDPRALAHIAALSDPLFLDCVFISKFNASVLQDNAPAVIPATWRKCQAVCWTDAEIADAQRSRLRLPSLRADEPTPRPTELLLYALWRDALAKEQLPALDGLRDWPIVPAVSRGRRLLLTPALLPHVFSHPPSELQDRRRTYLAHEAGRLTSLALPPATAPESGTSSYVWEWTGEPARSTDCRVVAVPEPVEARDSTPNPPPPPTSEPTAQLAAALEEREDAEASESHGGLGGIAPSLLSTLQRLGLPFLDGAILAGPPTALAAAAALPLGRRLLDALHAFSCKDDVRVHTLSEDGLPAVSEALIDFDAISVAERSTLLMEVHRAHREAALTPAQVDKLKTLRLFTSKDALRPTAISECSAAFWCENDGALEGIALASPPTRGASPGSDAKWSPPVILVNDRSLHEVYALAGVEELTAPAAVRRFTLPALSSMDGALRLQTLQGLAPRWSALKADAELVRQLSEIAFVPSWDSELASPLGEQLAGPYRRARELFSWGNEGLLSALAGASQGSYFAPPSLRRQSLHDMLADLGMAPELNKETYHRLALDIHNAATSASEDQRALLAAGERGRRLLRYLRAGDCAAALPLDSELARKLSKLNFVPVQMPLSLSTGGNITFAPQVCRFDQLLARSCGALGFSVQPVLDEDISPPLYFFSSFGISTQPSMETVLRHVSCLAACGEYLDRWNHPFFSIRSTYSALFQYLHDHWKDLSPAAVAQLKSSNIIPVGHTVVRPQRLFFRLAEDLSPFMHEVPRYFGAHEALLKKLGVKEAPAAADYVAFLRELAAECRLVALNPNELRAVLQIVHAISAQAPEAIAAAAELLFAPDEDSVLRCTLDLVLGDDCWLRDSVYEGLSSLGIHFLHPSVPAAAAVPLRVPPLSTVLLESLSPGAATVGEEGEGGGEYLRVSQAISTPQMAAALSALQSQRSLEAVSERLGKLQLRCLKKLPTRFVLRDPRRSSRDLPLELNDHVDRVDGGTMVFLDSSSDAAADSQNILYVNTSLLQPPVTLDTAVSIGLCKLLGLPVHLASSIATLLASAPAEVPRVLRSLRLGSGAAAAREKQRGAPGSPLVGADASLVELKPFRVFQLGEVVAFDDGCGLRYGRVQVVGEKGEGGARRLQLLTGSGSSLLLSTEVYSFRSARGRETSAGETPQKAARVSSTLDGFARGLARAAAEGQEPPPAAPALEPVRRQELLSAVSNLLVRAGVPLDLAEDSMVARIIDMDSTIKRLQEELSAERHMLSEAKDASARLGASLKCQICVAEENSHVAVPCGHQLCGACSGRCGSRCPFCRAAVRQFVRVFSEAAQAEL